MIPILLVAHFIADFVCQTDWMAINKSKRWDALAWHVAVYSVVLGGCVYAVAPTLVGWLLFVLGNALLHFATDAVTSRITSRLWFFRPVGITGKIWMSGVGSRHWFFVVIGLDQLIHTLTLYYTSGLLA